MTDSQKFAQVESIVNTYRRIEEFAEFIGINELDGFTKLFNTKGEPGILDFVVKLMSKLTDKIPVAELIYTCSEFDVGLDGKSVDMLKEICKYLTDVCNCMRKAPNFTHEFSPNHMKYICLLYDINIAQKSSLIFVYQCLKNLKDYQKQTPIFKIKEKTLDDESKSIWDDMNNCEQIRELLNYEILDY